MELKNLAGLAVALFLAACGGNSVPQSLGNQGVVAQAHSRSWMLPEAKHDDLLYVTDNGVLDDGMVHVFSYPAGKEVGTIGVGGNPEGECVDKAGDVWITRFSFTSVVEYAHGGGQIGSVSTYPNFPWGCAVDPTTGNLAVTNTTGYVGVYANAQGTPTLYTVAGEDGFVFCTYDDSGNLFATAGGSYVAELPKGSNEMMNLQFDYPSWNLWSIQWDERRKYLAVTAFRQKDEPTSIYHVSVSGTTGRLIGTTLLRKSKSGYPPQYWIEGARVLGPSSSDPRRIQKRIESWPYPAGGSPTEVAHVTWNGPGAPELNAVVVSKAQK